MTIDNYNPPKSAFLSINKDMRLLVDKILSNDRLKKLLFYTTRDALSKPKLTEEESISLFNKYLINLFPHVEKLNIIFDDGIEYLKKTNKQYDYIFSDIWHNVGDGEILYLKIKSLEKRFPTAKFDYWIERSILSMLRRQVLTVFSEQLEGYKEEDYLKARNENDEIINRLYFYLKSTEIDSFDALHDLISEESLKEIAKHLF